MKTLESELKTLDPQQKRALADWLWREADGAPELSPAQAELLEVRASRAVTDASKRFPLGDAERKLRR